MNESLTPEQWCDLADALGAVRAYDGAPLVIDGERLVELVREMREERDELRESLVSAHKAECCAEYATGSGMHSEECPVTELSHARLEIEAMRAERDQARADAVALRNAWREAEGDSWYLGAGKGLRDRIVEYAAELARRRP